MAKGGRRRRQKADSESDQDEDFQGRYDDEASSSAKVSYKDMSFAEKREHQRRAAADKRRTKMKVNYFWDTL